jgi:hypothetical protein
MQSKPLQSNKTALPVGESESFSKRNRWTGARIPSPLDTPLMGTPSLDTLPMTPEQNIYCLKRAFLAPSYRPPLIKGGPFLLFKPRSYWAQLH